MIQFKYYANLESDRLKLRFWDSNPGPSNCLFKLCTNKLPLISNFLLKLKLKLKSLN